MTMDIANLLPIGSIVKLQDTQKRLMIFGVRQTGQTPSGDQHADYVGVPYPEGNMGISYQYLFDHEQIEEIIFRGFEDSERDDFIVRLEEVNR